MVVVHDGFSAAHDDDGRQVVVLMVMEEDGISHLNWYNVFFAVFLETNLSD